MSGISIFINCIVLLAVISYLQMSVQCGGDTDSSVEERASRKDFSPMWFGPRVGRKKRNPGQRYYSNNAGKDDMYFLDINRELPWSVLAINSEGKPFVPRLGRESDEQGIFEFIQGLDLDLDERPTPPFVPRLGRQSTVYTPRLGRENDNVSPVN